MHCYILIINHDKPNHIKQYSSNESFIFEKKKYFFIQYSLKLEKFSISSPLYHDHEGWRKSTQKYSTTKKNLKLKVVKFCTDKLKLLQGNLTKRTISLPIRWSGAIIITVISSSSVLKMSATTRTVTTVTTTTPTSTTTASLVSRHFYSYTGSTDMLAI